MAVILSNWCVACAWQRGMRGPKAEDAPAFRSIPFGALAMESVMPEM